MNMGTNWKTRTGLSVAALAFILGQLGTISGDFANWGETLGTLWALYGIRHKLG